MLVCMAGAIITGALVASTTQVSISSAMPAASLAIILAVAGAITTASAVSARVMWVIPGSALGSNIPVLTVLPVILRKVSGVTNSVADLVIITLTVASA